MAVVIDSGSVEAEDLLRHVPTDKWRELMLARRRFLEIKLSHDCRCLVQFVNDAELMFSELGFKNPEAMIRDGHGLKPQEIKIAVNWLELNPPDDPVPLKEVIRLGKHGGSRKKGEQGGMSTLKQSQKNTKAHWLARLDRDGHAELAAQVRAKTLSANAAAERMGYRNPPDPLKQLHKWWDKASAEQRAAFLADKLAQEDRAA